MDKMNGIAKKILIGVGVLFAILIIAGIAGNKQLEEKAKTEPVAKDDVAKICRDFIFAAKEGDSLYDYVPDVWNGERVLEIGKTKDDTDGFQAQFEGSHLDEHGHFNCYVAGTKGDPKIYEITFVLDSGEGRTLYGEKSSWLKD